MPRSWLFMLLLAFARLLGGCGDDGAKPTPDACVGALCGGGGSSAKDLTSFSFLDATNPALAADVTATINGSAVAATVPAGTNVTGLVASFSTTGRTVAIAGVVQESGVSPHDFTNPVTYVVTAEDGTTSAYTVTVTVAASSAKDLTAFSFLDATNAALTADVTATINGMAIAATVPAGTDVAALVATFTTTGASVRVGATTQVSGATANDFTSPVMYVVTAADGTTRTYTATVTVAASSAKDLTAFSFLDATNAALTADVTATINGMAIAATVPAGTDVTALVATFTTTGASVRVGATTQVSGTTANSFASPVMYVVTAGDGTTKTYTVTVTVAASSAKDITAFSFLDATNPALTADVTATVDQGTGAINATVPAGTVVTALVASFTTTGASVRVGAATQSSGITANDFTSPVTYVVTAADSTTKTYTVTVTIAPSAAKDITAFSFLDATNPALTADVTATIDQGTGAIAATVPAGTVVTGLVATFTTTGASVRVGAATQSSGITANDFTNPVVYVVTAADSTMKTYTVTVTIAPSAAKDLTAFSFLDATNPALTADVTATIDPGTGAIAATVPAGTVVTGLVASFTTTGASVRIGAATQSSGITANDFTNPVVYVVTAADNSTKTYTVTVTIAPSATKDITAFSFLDATNPALTVDVTATIDQGTGAISATVPAATNVTALVATFTTTGASVSVGATSQVSGTTANDFTGPVVYVVTAADNSTKTYTVTVTVTGATPTCGAAPHAKLEPLGSLIAVMGGSTSPVTVSANICPATTVVMNVGETKSMNVTKGVPFFLTGSQLGSMPSLGPEYNIPVALTTALPAGVIMYSDGAPAVLANPAWDPATMGFIHLGSPRVKSGSTAPCNTVDGITYAVTGHPEAVIRYEGNGAATNTEGTAFLTIVTTGTAGSPEYLTITATKAGCTLALQPIAAILNTGRVPAATGRSSTHAGFEIRN